MNARHLPRQGDQPIDDNAPASGDAGDDASASGFRGRRKGDPIGRALRVAYDDMLRESIPDDFMDLLGKLD